MSIERTTKKGLTRKRLNQGFPKVPADIDLNLKRFLGSIRDSIVELQYTIGFFACFTDKQRANLLAAFDYFANSKNNFTQLTANSEALSKEIEQLKKEIEGLKKNATTNNRE
jgi:hypothetical protein